MAAAEPDCRRCGELEQQLAALESRLQFRPCGYEGPGTVLAEVIMPGGTAQSGRLCGAHQVLVGARTAFALRLVPGLGGQAGPCQWLVPAEESLLGGAELLEEADA